MAVLPLYFVMAIGSLSQFDDVFYFLPFSSVLASKNYLAENCLCQVLLRQCATLN